MTLRKTHFQIKMSRNSNIVRTTRETVSLDTLSQKLPPECYQSVINHLEKGQQSDVDDSIYQRYFQAVATPVITEEEKAELFETLGSQIVKGHFSTTELRSFLEKEPTHKKRR